jgi:tetratricopeptide (TPR) repeat protein
MPVSASIQPHQPVELVLSASHERSLRELALMMADNAGFKLALATFSGLKQRTLLIKRLTLLLERQGVALTQIVLTAGNPNASLLRSVKDHLNKLSLPAGSRHALSMIGLENLIALRNATGNRKPEGVNILEEANLHRDTFAKVCPFPLLIWLTSADTTAFAKTATDLWHWRSATFDFTDPPTDGPSTIGESIALQDSTTVAYFPEKLRERQALLENQLADLKSSLQTDTPRAISQRINLLVELGRVFHGLNDFDQARHCFEECLALAEQATDEDNISLALNELAGVFYTTGRFIEAEQLIRRALVINEKNHGSEHIEVATQLNNLATLLKDTNRLGEAEPLIRRALDIDERNYGPDHPTVAIMLNNLAQLLQSTSRLEEAELLMRRALTIDEKSNGLEHPKVAIRLNNLARLLQDTNRLAEAEPLMRRALAICEKCYGPDHPNVATVLNNLGRLLHDTNRLAEAEPLMRRALIIDEKHYDQDHPDVAFILNNLALLLKDTNRLAEAELLSRRALSIATHSFGLDHPSTKSALNNYMGILSEMKFSEPEIQAKLRALTGQ